MPMVQKKNIIRTVHNPANEDILLDWYEKAGTKVKMQTKKTTAKNGVITNVRQIVVE